MLRALSKEMYYRVQILTFLSIAVEDQLIFCEVGSVTGQGVMRIYVESSVKKPNFFKKQNFEKSEGAKWF